MQRFYLGIVLGLFSDRGTSGTSSGRRLTHPRSMLDCPEFGRMTMEDEVAIRSCSWCFPTAYGYRKRGQM